MDASVQSEIDLIGHIYDAVIEPDGWTDTIDRIRLHFGFHIAMLGVSVFPSGSLIIEASSNVPELYVQSIKKFGTEALDMWGGVKQITRMPSEEPLVYSHLTDPKLRVGNPYFEQWVVPQGLVDQMVIILENNPAMMATLGLGIHQSMPPIGDAQIEGMRMLAPHLRRAVIISGLLESRAQAAASFEGVLSGLGSAVVLVDEFMQVIYANPKAEQMLQHGDPITNIHGRLGVPHQLVAGQLEATVAAAVKGGAKLAQAGSGIAARRRDETGVIIHVLPLQRRMERVSWRAVAAVFVAEPSAPIDLPVDAIKLLYGLRPAEARVLELIVAGLSGPHIAEALGIAPSTVKTHTLRLFDKLDTHSRAGVVKLARAMSFVAP